MKYKEHLMEADAYVKDKILSQFSPSPIAVDGGKKVHGVTIKDLKDKLRGAVPQDQKKFIDFITSLGFDAKWSNDKNAYVVFKP